MLTATTSLPYSFFQLMADQYSVVTEGYAHRQDRLISDYYGSNIFLEAMCNEASNVSPISLIQGTEYYLPSKLFQKYFLEVGR